MEDRHSSHSHETKKSLESASVVIQVCEKVDHFEVYKTGKLDAYKAHTP